MMDEEMTLPRLLNVVAFAVATVACMVLIVWFGNATTYFEQQRYLLGATACAGWAIVGAGMDYYLKHRNVAAERQRGFPVASVENPNET